ncbi:MAG: ADOP family duplicated permease [Vicinamibacterales bacterium]
MKWSRFWQRQRRDTDLQRELTAYLEQESADRMAAGATPEEARWAAQRKLGSVTRIREQVFEQNSLLTLETLWRDVVYAGRLFRRNPGFSLVAILSIALGIGANASVFTLLDQVMLRTLPVARPDQLVRLTATGFQYGNAFGDGDELSYPMYQDLRDGNQVFAGMFCRFARALAANVNGSGEAVRAELVSGSYFPLLGIHPAIGRVLGPDDEQAPGAHPFVVLSHRYWQRRFHANVAVVGQAIRVNGHPLTIVGVVREGFDGTDLGSATDVFVPIAMAHELTFITTGLVDRRSRWLNVFGRLKPGVSREEADAGLQPFYHSRLELEVAQDAFARASSSDKSRFLKGSLAVTPAADGKSSLRAQLTQPLWTLTAIGVGVLIIACANVANLLLARASVRRREIAMRLALGATRRRILHQLLIESVLLGVAGGAAGLALATLGAEGLLFFFVEPDAILTISAWPDARLLAINVLASVAIGVAFGLAPAWQSARSDLGPVLKAEGSGVLGGGSGHVRRALVVAQVAVSLLLMVGASVFLRSLENLRRVETGFDTTRLLSFNVAPGAYGYAPAATKTFAKALLDSVRATPGVSAAGFVSNRLLDGGSWNSSMTIEGRPYDPAVRVLTYNNRVSPGYFEAMGIRVVAGRDFDSRDERHVDAAAPAAPPRVVIANEEFAKRFLADRDPLGVHIGFGRDPGTPTPIEIVGVVSTAKYRSLRSEPEPQLYVPYLEGPSVGGLTMYVRTSRDPQYMMEAMRQVVRRADAALPVSDLRTLEEQVNRSLTNDRFVASVSTALGALATVLAMVGLYGVMSFAVARRTREIAIRVAFGALSTRVVSLILGDMFVLVGAGIMLALPAIWWLKRLVEDQLYQVSPSDARALIPAVAVVLLSAVVAVWVPSRRALRVDPVTALRDE